MTSHARASNGNDTAMYGVDFVRKFMKRIVSFIVYISGYDPYIWVVAKRFLYLFTSVLVTMLLLGSALYVARTFTIF